MQTSTKQVMASQLKAGDLIDGYDKVVIDPIQYLGSYRVATLCNIKHYDPSDMVEIAAAMEA